MPQEALRAALGAVFMFVEESVGKTTPAAVLARIMSGLESPNVPPGSIED
jgi:hypothetical protein